MTELAPSIPVPSGEEFSHDRSRFSDYRCVHLGIQFVQSKKKPPIHRLRAIDERIELPYYRTAYSRSRPLALSDVNHVVEIQALNRPNGIQPACLSFN